MKPRIQDKDFTADDLVALLTARYDVGEEQARADVDKLLASWRQAGLIEG